MNPHMFSTYDRLPPSRRYLEILKKEIKEPRDDTAVVAKSNDARLEMRQRMMFVQKLLNLEFVQRKEAA